MELIATRETGSHVAAFALNSSLPLVLGRDEDADISVPWEPFLSRRHFEVRVEDGSATFNVRDDAKNPAYLDGTPRRSFTLAPGKSFVVGETIFTLRPASATPPSASAEPVEEVTFGRDALKHVRFADADRRIDVLAHLPEVIRGTGGESELDVRLLNLLLAGIVEAEAVAVVEIGDDGRPSTRNWERRDETAGRFEPSSRLVRAALTVEKSTVLHVWEPASRSGAEYTASADSDWAFCTPVATRRGQPWGLYIAGRFAGAAAVSGGTSPPGRIHADVKFAELVAEMIAAVESTKTLEGRLSVLRQFLSPPILSAIEAHGEETDLLTPRETDVTVLFCDLRNFSGQVEGASGNLLKLLDRVNRALEVMTTEILARGGVTGDFLGDAVLGFWGWPFASEDTPMQACRTALAIRAAFETGNESLGFRVGIGLAHGRAVAGKIGTTDRVTVTVFGPVVNLASRLQSMTRHLRVPILMDETLAALTRERLPTEQGQVRKLGTVIPYGLEQPLTVAELLPPEGQPHSLSAAQIANYELGVAAFESGDWETAYRQLHQMPAHDRAQDFLLSMIAQHDRRAPDNWTGVVPLRSKE